MNIELIAALKTMPTCLLGRVRVTETIAMCEELGCTMSDIKLHNAAAEACEEGYKKAVDKFIKWRDQLLLEAVSKK